MAIVVRNEFDGPIIFGSSAGSRQIAPGQTLVISDEEWGGVVTVNRGPGGLHALASDPSSRVKTLFDYSSINGVFEVVYVGQADQSALTTDATWTIKKFGWTAFAGVNQITSVEVLDSVIWDNRTTLPWT